MSYSSPFHIPIEAAVGAAYSEKLQRVIFRLLLGGSRVTMSSFEQKKPIALFFREAWKLICKLEQATDMR
ncbi:hypothetical protein LguiA_004394 [Lonicera macranthoides]